MDIFNLRMGRSIIKHDFFFSKRKKKKDVVISTYTSLFIRSSGTITVIWFWKLFFRFDVPVIPKDFVPQHKFPGPLETNYKLTDDPPPEVSPPEDNNLKLLIEGVATLVARCGKLFEDLSREKNLSNPLFNFLTGGNGHDYYTRKLWEERQKRANQRKQQVDGKLSSSMQKMTAESRGKILGEKPLEKSTKDSSSSVASSEVIHLQFNLSDTFTKPSSFVSGMQHFIFLLICFFWCY